jgi:hypothetical protein
MTKKKKEKKHNKRNVKNLLLNKKLLEDVKYASLWFCQFFFYLNSGDMGYFVLTTDGQI